MGLQDILDDIFTPRRSPNPDVRGRDVPITTEGLEALPAAQAQSPGTLSSVLERLQAQPAKPLEEAENTRADKMRALRTLGLGLLGAKGGENFLTSLSRAGLGASEQYEGDRQKRQALMAQRDRAKAEATKLGVDVADKDIDNSQKDTELKLAERRVAEAEAAGADERTLTEAKKKLALAQAKYYESGGKSGTSVYAQKIDDLVAIGVPREKAVMIAANAVRLGKDPLTDMPWLISMLGGPPAPTTGTVPGAQPNEGGQPAAAPGAPQMTPIPPGALPPANPGSPVPGGAGMGQPGQETIYNQAPNTAGVGSALGNITSGIFGQINQAINSNLLPTSPEMVRARQDVTTAQQDLVRALSNNPRFPATEMERIRKEIDIDPGILDSTQSVRQRMIGIDANLVRRQVDAERDAANPALTKEKRKEASDAATEIRNFRAKLGVPPDVLKSGLAPGVGAATLPKSDQDLINKYTKK